MPCQVVCPSQLGSQGYLTITLFALGHLLSDTSSPTPVALVTDTCSPTPVVLVTDTSSLTMPSLGYSTVPSPRI